MPDVSTTLTEQALERLRKLADGNGLTPASIELVEATEEKYKLTGAVRLTPKFETQSRTAAGPVKSKTRRTVAGFAALQEEVAQQKKAFLENDPWLDAALKDLHAAPGFGWGMEGAKITLPDHAYSIVATERCPTCHGNRLLTCPQCAGKKNFLCRFCHGTRQEVCPNCFGNGQDPVNAELPCPVCRGNRRISCRQCQGTGVTACPTCHGSGGTTCGTCSGNGSLTQEIVVEGSAEVEFKMGRGTGLPAGLLRALDRLGVANLVKGHGDVEIDETPDEDDKPLDKKTVKLVATIPYADIKVRFNGKGAIVSSFGKRGVLFGIPPFLDDALKPWRDALKRSIRDGAELDKALEVRLMQDALKLELAGKGNPAELRRLYSVGLAPATAFEVMRDMRLALRSVTKQARIAVAAASVILSIGLFAGLFLTSVHDQLSAKITNPQNIMLLDLGVFAAALALSWLAIQQSTRFVLRRRFKNALVKRSKRSGKIGYSALGCIVAAYVFILALTPQKPDWLTHFLK